MSAQRTYEQLDLILNALTGGLGGCTGREFVFTPREAIRAYQILSLCYTGMNAIRLSLSDGGVCFTLDSERRCSARMEHVLFYYAEESELQIKNMFTRCLTQASCSDKAFLRARFGELTERVFLA